MNKKQFDFDELSTTLGEPASDDATAPIERRRERVGPGISNLLSGPPVSSDESTEPPEPSPPRRQGARSRPARQRTSFSLPPSLITYFKAHQEQHCSTMTAAIHQSLQAEILMPQVDRIHASYLNEPRVVHGSVTIEPGDKDRITKRGEEWNLNNSAVVVVLLDHHLHTQS